MPKRLLDLREQAPLLDIVSYGRRGPGRPPIFSPAERDYIGRTVRGVPEVMIKVSGGGNTPDHCVRSFGGTSPPMYSRGAPDLVRQRLNVH